MREHNPNNWHWTNKNCLPWAKEYFSKALTNISAEDGANKVTTKSLSSCEGDVDVNQRKGKIRTLYDVKLVIDFEGATKDDETVTGTITIPEVAHDTEEDEYVFDIDIFSETSSKEVLRPLIRNKLVPQLRKKLSQFSHDLIETHGKDVYNPSLNSTPNTSVTATPVVSKPPTPAPAAQAKGKTINTTDLTDDIEFTATAADLYSAFVDPEKLAKWTRNPVQIDPKVGGEFVLFNGNIRGKFLVLEKDKKIEQTWRLPTWPEDHYCTLKLVFDQGINSTILRVQWTGVPLNEEDVIKKKFDQFYVQEINNLAESLRSHHITQEKGMWWSVDKVFVAVVVTAVLIAALCRYTFGYGLLL